MVGEKMGHMMEKSMQKESEGVSTRELEEELMKQ